MDKSINIIEPSLLAVFITCYVMCIILTLMTITQIFNVPMQLMCFRNFSFSLRVICIHYTRLSRLSKK